MQANLAGTRLLGYPRHVLLGRRLKDFIAGDSSIAFNVFLTRLFETSTKHNSELELRVTGRRIWVMAEALADSEDSCRAVVVDITTRIEHEKALKASEQQFRRLVEGNEDYAIIMLDLQGHITTWNRGAARISGYEADEIIGQHFSVFYPPEEVASGKVELELNMALTDGKYEEEDIRVRKDGTTFWANILITPIYNEAGKPMGFSKITHDITERKLAERELQFASTVYQALGDGIMVLDMRQRIVTVNTAFTQVTGYTEADLVGQNWKTLLSSRHDTKFYQDLSTTLKGVGSWQGVIWNRHKNGEEHRRWLILSSIYNDHGGVEQYVGMVSEITDQKLAEQTIWKQANFDLLTGLPNRRMFQDRLKQEIKKSRRSGLPVALMFIDLDHFKEVNDTLGHDVGDLLLKEAASRLSSCARETDTVARMGGDEFTIILAELDDPDSVERVAETILHKLAEPFQLGDEMVYVSASIGITFYPMDSSEVDELLKNADQAMYAAKQQGRNCYRYFTPSMQEAAQNRMRLANDMRGALEAKEFRVFYQPIVELATGDISKAEALIRWQHPQRGRISPAEFIPVAEDTGLIIDIGNWVFREVANQVMHWRRDHNPSFQVSVNKSPAQFHDEHHDYAAWPEYLKELGIPGQSIVIEITEGLLLNVSNGITNQLLGFRDAGIEVSLDDFGVGYSSLSYLKKFDIDNLKIDKAFVRNLTPESDDMALCKAIIVMAHALGMKVIAEGVETQQQRDLLTEAECDYGQGYLFSRPVPAKEFERLL